MQNTRKAAITIVVETITTIMRLDTTITMGMRDTKVNFYLPAVPGYFNRS
ncbi:hypothetical protein [Helicobacter gastrocanis]|nr:hypothetical protein [Helicobacter sp. NHP19-003]